MTGQDTQWMRWFSWNWRLEIFKKMITIGFSNKQAQEGNSRVRLEMTNKRVPPPKAMRYVLIQCWYNVDTISIQYRYKISTIQYPKTPKNTQKHAKYPKIPKNTQNHPKILKNDNKYPKISESTLNYLKYLEKLKYPKVP